MRRTALIAAGALGLAAVATGGAAQASSAPPGSLTHFICQRALDPPARGIAVTAVVRPVPGTGKLQVKFDLLRSRRRRGPARLLHGGTLGKWQTPSNPTLGRRPGDVWRDAGSVADLPAPYWYRLRVSFRWLGTNGAKLRQYVRTTAPCYQPELRPDLLVRSLTVKPASGGEDLYAAVVANRGASAAGPFRAQLAEGARVVLTRTVGRLSRRSARRVRFLAPACTAGNLVTLTLDPEQAIDEWDRSNDSLAVTCPG